MVYSVTLNEYYIIRRIMSYPRNEYVYRIIIGARGVGKTFAIQNLTCNFYKKNKSLPDDPTNVDDLFIYIRFTRRALANYLQNILDSKLQDKHKIIPTSVSKEGYDEIYYNGKLVGIAVALADAPAIKGGTWHHQRFRYVILDEFQRERNERRTFDVNYNLRSILESMTRFTTRIREGRDYPTIIAAGNTVDEATDLLYAFDFMPLEYGVYKLKSKSAIIEYVEDGKAYQRMQAINPLRVLSQGDDFTFGERKLTLRDNIIKEGNTGHRRYVAHLQMTPYIRFEVWQIDKGRLYISNGLPTAKFENRILTLARLAANRGTNYNIDFHKLIRRQYENNSIYFDKNLTAKIFNMNIV